MTMRNLKIAAAVALAIGGISAAHAAPTPAQCAAPGASLYVAGSSAAQNAFGNGLATDLFGGAANETVLSGTSGNFKAYCGASTNAAVAPAGTIVTVYYRAEGGSVVGALPIVSGKAIKFLDPALPGCAVAAPVVNGTSAANGTNDSWTGCVTTHQVEMGVTDLEPGVFKGANYPSAYSVPVFGSASAAQLAALSDIALFQQVFGLFVNTTGINGGGAGQAINLSRETVANILNGNYSDWSAVPSATGGAVSSTPQAITLVNREAGSGTRAGVSLYFLGNECTTSPFSLSDPGPDGFATGDVLTTANATNGAITYASIDNNGAKPNLTMASLSGVVPSNLAAATGQYDWWYEATAQKGNITSPGGLAIYNFLVGGELQNVATAPHSAQVNAIPNVGTNLGAVPLVSNTLGGKTIYINPFTRSLNSCNIPSETN